MQTRAFIAYCSPAGSTRRTAEVIEQTFRQNGVEPAVLDIGRTAGRAAFFRDIEAAGPSACLMVGSPVYRDVAVPPVMRFIEALPAGSGAAVAPFVTWGHACSGLALWQMGSALVDKGYRLVGAAKVAAVHSIMWNEKDPIGQGRPNEDDLGRVQQFVRDLLPRLQSKESPSLSLDSLAYQPTEMAEKIREKMTAPWMIVPKEVDTDACTQCGVCESECPVGAISLDPYPVFGDDCFSCFNCIRLCPEDAITPAMPLEKIAQGIRKRVETIGEQPLTEVF